GTVTAAGEYVETATMVTVTDGRLSLSVPGAPGHSAKLNYVQIIGIPSGPNAPPSAPQILEPTFAGQVVNPSDVHMEAIGYQDPDGDQHVNSDWEIWTVDSAGVPLERVWATTGIPGVERY